MTSRILKGGIDFPRRYAVSAVLFFVLLALGFAYITAFAVYLFAWNILRLQVMILHEAATPRLHEDGNSHGQS